MTLFQGGAARADNPVVQTIYTADPAPLVHNDRVYLYTGHDEDGSTYFTMRDWRVFSSSDMVNWTDHGSPLSLATFSWASTNAWAGHVVARNGQFYWYVPVTNRATGRMAIGVAVSDSPTGPFRDALGRPLVENGEIDPAVYIDDNGQAYLYWGNPNLWYVRLNADMTSFTGGPTQIPLTTAGFGRRDGNPSRPTLYEEAPWVYQRNGLSYMVFAANCCSESIAYSTAQPHRALDLPGNDHARAGQQLHQPPRDHPLPRQLVLLLPQRGTAGRRRLHPLGRRGEVPVPRRRHHPDAQHDHRRGATAGHAQPVRPPGGGDERLGLRRRDRTVQ
ncbi:hypothetical protein GCM10022245_19430 [Streptomyces mayteni]